MLQPKRWRVEQTYGILVLHRRLVRDYEHRPSSAASRLYWATTPAWRDAQAVMEPEASRGPGNEVDAGESSDTGAPHTDNE
ncbi:hypothetical protein ACFXDH_54295 [Streptomyces sp. NPDC059467]|uniref:hypothetical protein n=1 Tax=Streptomyces sp. NPDC059467 TaxID=3346844 RepID=UPI0036C3E754